MTVPIENAFQKNFAGGKTQLVWRFLPGDLETPVAAYLKLCGGKTPSFLLESVEGGQTLGRYSIIGYDPDIIWRCGVKAGDPLEEIRRMLTDSRIDASPEDLPPMAVSGLFGYIGYDMIRHVEKIPDGNPDDLFLPEAMLVRPRMLVIFDNVKNTICLVTPVYDHAGNTERTADEILNAASQNLDRAERDLGRAVPDALVTARSALKVPLDIKSNMGAEDYRAAVKKAIGYIHEGEIFQAVLAQRFTADFDLPPIALYRSLRALNPSPFMVHMDFGDFALVASSPEIMVRVRDGIATIRPIAGTRPRGGDAIEDKALEEELLADEKERAEHLMLLDLGRNDIGRIAEFGSVRVTEAFTVERYSHVMHIVSNVEGKLRADMDILDAHFAGFPAGTVSGAPKIRAMEIIDELEAGRRGVYGGSMGYFSANGAMDTCIALRTAVLKDGKIHVQAGAGIVADSDPQAEYRETVNKASALFTAAEAAIRRSQETRRN